MNYDRNDCQQFSFITPFFSDTADTLKTKVRDVVGCIFEVDCSVGGFLDFETNCMMIAYYRI
jgi:hypothetical protein